MIRHSWATLDRRVHVVRGIVVSQSSGSCVARPEVSQVPEVSEVRNRLLGEGICRTCRKSAKNVLYNFCCTIYCLLVLCLLCFMLSDFHLLCLLAASFFCCSGSEASRPPWHRGPGPPSWRQGASPPARRGGFGRSAETAPRSSRARKIEMPGDACEPSAFGPTPPFPTAKHPQTKERQGPGLGCSAGYAPGCRAAPKLHAARPHCGGASPDFDQVPKKTPKMFKGTGETIKRYRGDARLCKDVQGLLQDHGHVASAGQEESCHREAPQRVRRLPSLRASTQDITETTSAQ